MKQPKINFKGREYEVMEIEWKNGEIKKIRFYFNGRTEVIFQSNKVKTLTEDENFGYYHAPDLSEFIK